MVSVPDVLDIDDEHIDVCRICRRMAIVKYLILDLDLDTEQLHELKSYLSDLIEGSVYND